jgi:glycosyltransferase involved in cell wall biosynthesis
MSRLRILAIAYACNPTRGSEAGLGWGWVNSIAAGHDVTVITADYNCADINRYVGGREGLTGNIPRFIYVRNRPWHYSPSRVWLKLEGSLAKPLVNLAYQNWLKYAFEEAKSDVAKNGYDLVHLITYVGWRFPGRFYQLAIPFVWGPIGGMKNTPWRLLHLLGFKGAFYYAARNLINTLQLRTLQGPRHALRAADKGVIAATSEIQQELWGRFKAESRVICEVGQPSIAALVLRRRDEAEPFRICWSGMHLPGKALNLLLRAAARLPTEFNYTIEILGDGPCNRAWRTLASRLRISDRCHWHGWLAREQSLEVMGTSHILSITSLKDLTSTVAVEAVSLGIPIVCLDHCGFADLVTDECGIKIYPGSALQISCDFADALGTLYRDEALRQRLSQGAIRRSRDYSWRSKMVSLNEVYRLALESRQYATARSD